MDKTKKKRPLWKTLSFWTHSVLLILLAFVTGLLVICAKTQSIDSSRFRERFEGIAAGMTKGEVLAVIARPLSIDTTGSGTEVWRYGVPVGGSDFPNLYFDTSNRKLVKFDYWPIRLVDSSFYNLSPQSIK